jgi:acyl carrier protein
MDKREIEQILRETLKQIQVESGHPHVEISEETCPLDEIPGFDSLTAIEATVELARRLGRELPEENIFVNSEGRGTSSIGEIAERLHEMFNPKVASHE